MQLLDAPLAIVDLDPHRILSRHLARGRAHVVELDAGLS